MQSISTDILVIGGGLAGIMAALEAARAGTGVILTTKSSLLKTSGNTAMAGGGFAAACAFGTNNDSPASHGQDTIKSGAWVNNPDLVNKLTAQAPRLVQSLADSGIPFVEENGRFKQFQLAGHSHPRAIRLLGGGTGDLLDLLGKELDRCGVKILAGFFVKDLLKEQNRIIGAVGMTKDKTFPVVVKAKAVILAGGGGGNIFPLTTNKKDTTGDGLAMALRAGLYLKDMEFIQFTPTAMAYPRRLAGQSIGGILLSQPQARLYNGAGARFMLNYAPDKKEAATRDIIARAAYREILAGRGTGHGGVFLDVTGVPAEILKSTGNVFNFLWKQGIDLSKQQIEIAPAVHFFMGGVEIDSNCSTGIDGLFAAGEVTAGVHGANRLSGNGLTEALVFGTLAGASAARYTQEAMDNELSDHVIKDMIHTTMEKPAYSSEPARTGAIHGKLQQVALRALGVERQDIHLQEALLDINKLELELDRSPVINHTDQIKRYELENMLLVTKAAVLSARERTESRGAHYRVDYPQQDDVNWLKNIGVKLQDGEMVTRFTPANSLNR